MNNLCSASDPATTTLIFVFLVSTSYNSLAIWRRRLTIPPSIQLRLNIRIEAVKKELRKKTHIIRLKCVLLHLTPCVSKAHRYMMYRSPALRPDPLPPARIKVIPPSRTPTPAPAPAPPPEVKTVVIQEPGSHDVIIVPQEKEVVVPKKKKVKWWQIWKRIRWGSDDGNG